MLKQAAIANSCVEASRKLARSLIGQPFGILRLNISESSSNSQRSMVSQTPSS